jgi:hypothetical protein
MVLDKRTLILVDSDVGAALLKKISTALLIPLETNEPHEVRSVLRKLAKECTITHLMPNVIHDVQLLAAAPQLMSAHKEIHKEPMHLIVVGMLGVDGAAVDAVHDVVDR